SSFGDPSHERPNLLQTLLPVLGLKAAGCVHAKGPNLEDQRLHVPGAQTPRHEEAPAVLDAELGPGPVRALPGTPRECPVMGVEKVRAQWDHGELRWVRKLGAAEHVPDLARDVGARVEPPGYLDRVKREVPRDRGHLIRALFGEHADDGRLRRKSGADRLRLLEG